MILQTFTGREPHPILPMLTEEEEERLIQLRGKEAVQAIYHARADAMYKEKTNPRVFAYRPPIWFVCDELLIDGKECTLVDPDWDLNDPELRKIRPRDFLDEAARRKQTGEGKITIMGRSEIWVAGSQRSSKSEWAGRKCIEVLDTADDRRGWSFADTETVSIARQQPILWKYMPPQFKSMASATGRQRRFDNTTRIVWSKGGGFAGQTFVLPPPCGSQHWFKNYGQNIDDMEGDQLDIVWFDEPRNVPLIKTIRFRMGDRGGIVITTFTSIEESFSPVNDEYDTGSITVLETDAELLPLRDANGNPNGKFEKVPRVKIAGPGSDGNQRANIVFFHITDNPYYGATAKIKPGEKPMYGKERFYALFPPGTMREKILARVYGVLTKSAYNQFSYNDMIHTMPLNQFSEYQKKYPDATRYHLVDPCSGRPWFMGWFFCPYPGKVIMYREWPSYGHPGAYIEGIGDPGPWAIPSISSAGGKGAFDGDRGPAQRPNHFGLGRYKEEIEKAEKGETIFERWIDARYGNSAVQDREGTTTLIEQLNVIGMDFIAMTSEKKILNVNDGSIDMINSALYVDRETDRGAFSPSLGRLNEPVMSVVETCPNTINSLKRWTGKDGQNGAMKDPIDIIRGFFLSDLGCVNSENMKVAGGCY